MGYLDYAGLSHFKDKLTTIFASINHKHQSASSGSCVYYVAGTGTAAITTSPYNYAKWEANLPEITTLYDGLTIAYKVPVAGNGTYGTCLQINSLGYHPVVRAVNSMISTRYAVNATIVLTYQSTVSGTVYANSASSSTIAGCWVVVNDVDNNSNTISSAWCGTAAATAAKVADCTNYALLDKSYLHVLMRYSNSSASAITLNVNSVGAKAIYINGTASSSTNYTLPAGSYLAYYENNIFYFRTDGKLANPNGVSVAWNSVTNKPSFSTVATSGSYNDLSNKPSLATVATSGSYADLSNKPTIPDAQIQSDWNQTSSSAKDYIKNKPNVLTAVPNASTSVVGGIKTYWDGTTSTLYITDNGTNPTP